MRANPINKSNKFKIGVNLYWITNGAYFGEISKVMKTTIKVSRPGGVIEILTKITAIKMIKNI